MSFEEQPNANIESELNELRINSMIKALGTQREQALNQTAKLLGDLAVEKARVTIMESRLTSANSRLDALAAAHALLAARVPKLETLLEIREAELTRYMAPTVSTALPAQGPGVSYLNIYAPTVLGADGAKAVHTSVPIVPAPATGIAGKFGVSEELPVKIDPLRLNTTPAALSADVTY